MILLLTYLFSALIISFLCSIMEAVLLSTPQTFLMSKRDQGKVWANKFMVLKENIDKPLSAILSLNTVAHTVGAAGVGAQSVKVFGEAYFGLVSAVLTILILIFTEIIPKTIGAQYWRQLAKTSSRIIRGMIVITYPLVMISIIITKSISGQKNQHTTSREEILALTDIGLEEGVVHENEYKIIQNILRLKNVQVTEIMTPRVVLVAADATLHLRDFLANKEYLRFSRIPVYSGERGNIVGYVISQFVIEKLAEDNDQLQLIDIIREIVVVPSTNAIFSVWELLLEKKEHIALIVDEYGSVGGIVTMEDIIETMLGLEIVDEKDVATNMRQYARDKWQKKQLKFKLMDNISE
jgi:CBS domain containing-hemolysin-like protein